MPRVCIGADHAGLPLKIEMLKVLGESGCEVLDVGALRYDPLDDYPDFARSVGECVARGEAEKGILVCGSGVGAGVAANKIKGVRAAVCHDTYSARQGVEHDDMNVLCMGARIIGVELAGDIVRAFVAATFTGEERHVRRLKKVLEIESGK
ncbi:MAG: ribose 5-phosphate isomerase B [Candidatus Omnitrophica bacterium]|nr:Ribose-5-phosphate isomerase B [bacterium]NUN95813.1 ribose 5-phosphate isomerase B [Candidatus Omnitrophota bacterium]